MSKQIVDDIIKILSIDTSNHRNFDVVTSLLLKTFYYAHESIVLGNVDSRALLIGLNCNLVNLDNAIVFSGHIDTVPDDGLQIIYDGKRIFGRGTSDMKSFFLCLNDALTKVLSNVRFPIILAISFDEEIATKSINLILDYFHKYNIKAKYCIVGEPTSLNCSLSHRGCYDYKLELTANSMHSGISTKDNPIIKCSEFISKLQELNLESGVSLAINKITGGTALNCTPSKCTLYYEIRTDSITKLYSLKKSVAQILCDYSNFTLQELDTFIPPFDNRKSKIVDTVLKLNTLPKMKVCQFEAASEASFFMNEGIDTIIFGPGNLECAHSRQEYIDLYAIEAYSEAMQELLINLNELFTTST